MKIIDRYFIKLFSQTILFALAAFTLIFVIIDMMENLDDFIDQSVPYHTIFEYYLYFIPEIIRLMIPVAVFLSCLFTAGKMANQNELTAVKSGGTSLYRIMQPFIAIALVISLFSILFVGYIVPLANKGKVVIERVQMKKGIISTSSNIFFQDSETRIVSIYYFDSDHFQANRVSIQEFSKKDPTHMIRRLDAPRIIYDTTLNVWEAFNGIERTFVEKREQLTEFNRMKLDYLNFLPSDVTNKQQRPEEMTLTELWEFYKNQLRTGNDPTRTLIEFHSRFAFSMASFVVVFLGLPLASTKKRGGLALQFGLSLLFTFLYLGFMKISQAFGKNGVMDPLLTAWFANIVFMVGAAVILVKVQK